MADKRNSHNRVATPKIGGAAAGGSPAMQPLSDPLETLSKAVGAKVRVTTAVPHSTTLEGILFTACPVLDIVAINTRTSSAQASVSATADYHVIPISRIQSFQIVALSEEEGADYGTSFANVRPAIGFVETKALLQRERSRVQSLQEEARHQGKGVSAEAQAIYDAIRRINMPIRWHKIDMVVHEAVIISPPYRVEDCKGPRDKQEVLSRVKRVLDGERRKILEKERKTAVAATGGGGTVDMVPRKGG